MNLEVLYSAAHAEFPDTEPLGGGKAVADYLIREWQESKPFPLTVLSPKSLGSQLPKPLAQLSELQYARFCRKFERAATAEILKHDPQQCVVLSNDISEGPDFRALGERGYRIVTIFHVDVVEYFTRFYLHGLIRPETAARFRWFGVMPDVLRLVFEKQSQCVQHSQRILVPSAPMKKTILRCYPRCVADKIVVLPWGNVAVDQSPHPNPLPISRGEGARIASPLPSSRGEGQGEGSDIDDNEIVIITLSRLSPEKGIERLLAALPHLNSYGKKVRVFICGGAAYMQGRAYERKLRRLTESITTIRVEFTGHVVGAEKAALLDRADIFVSPSRHESYGLTIAEALAAGCRVISHNHYGAQGEVVDCADPRALAAALSAMVTHGRTQKPASPRPEPSRAAEELAKILCS
ncbi:MAG TPA: glycosyltransferase family 4 protein [Verrucomicrobiae bacterium]|nr:glycosyltransferase family 4 protein [Verrucomicrobiae bacterium]